MFISIFKFDPNQPRDRFGRWTPVGGKGYEMYSSNEHESSDFAGAQKNLDTPAYRAFAEKSAQIDKALGITVKSNPALGDTKEWGTEESYLDDISPDASFDMIRVSAAMKGWLANQLGVIAFKEDPKGDHFMYELDIPLDRGSMEDIRKALDEAGLDYRTFVPGSKSTRVVMYDAGWGLAESVEKISERFQTPHTYYRGVGELIDSQDRAESRRKYEGLIQEQMGNPRVKRAWDLVRSWRSYEETRKRLIKRYFGLRH